MKYAEMTKFLNNSGIMVMQPVIANEVSSQLPIGCDISEDEFEEICEKVFQTYLDSIWANPDIDIWYLVDEELTERGYKEV
jgi:hypothetical protein